MPDVIEPKPGLFDDIVQDNPPAPLPSGLFDDIVKENPPAPLPKGLFDDIKQIGVTKPGEMPSERELAGFLKRFHGEKDFVDEAADTGVVPAVVGKTLHRAGQFLKAAVTDLPATTRGMIDPLNVRFSEAEQEQPNIRAFAEHPEAQLPVEKTAGTAARIGLGVVGALPTVGAAIGLGMVGVPPIPANVATMAFDEKGEISPVGVAAAVGLPIVDKFGRRLASDLIVKKLGDTKGITAEIAADPMKLATEVVKQHPLLTREGVVKAIEIGSGQMLNNLYLLAIQTPGILESDNPKQALLETMGSNLGLSILGAPEAFGAKTETGAQLRPFFDRSRTVRTEPPQPPPKPEAVKLAEENHLPATAKAIETLGQESGKTPEPKAPVPETAEAIITQMKVTEDPNSTKAVTLVTPGSPRPAEGDLKAHGLEAVETPHGLAVFNPAKTTRDAVLAAGEGKDFDGTLLGMSTSAKPVPAGDTVVQTTLNGVPVLDEVVPNTPEAIEKARAAHAAAVPGGVTVVRQAGEILAERKQATEKGAKDASEVTSPAEVHGNVQPQPKPSEGALPTEEGGAGVQPREEPPAPGAPEAPGGEGELTGKFKIPPQIGQGDKWFWTADWRKTFDAETDIETKIDWLRAVANNRGSKATAQDLADVLDRAEALSKTQKHSRLVNTFWDVAQNPAASPETKQRALRLDEESRKPDPNDKPEEADTNAPESKETAAKMSREQIESELADITKQLEAMEKPAADATAEQKLAYVDAKGKLANRANFLREALKIKGGLETPPPAPSSPPATEAAIKPPPAVEEKPVAAPDLESLLQAPEPNVELLRAARERVKDADRRQAILRDDHRRLEAKAKEIEKVIKPQRGNAYTKSKIKKSAPKAQVAEWRELHKRMAEMDAELRQIDDAVKEDRALLDAAQDAAIVSDVKQPMLRRLDRQVRRMEGKAPPELTGALERETARVIREKYPDVTPEEIKKMTGEVQRSAYFGGELWNHPSTPNLHAMRRAELDAAVNAPGVQFPELSDDLRKQLDRYQTNRPYAAHEPVQNLTAEKLAELKKRVATETESRVAKEKEAQEKEAREVEARKAEEQRLLEEAQSVVNSVKRAGTPGGPTGKQVKDELVRRIEVELEKLVESGDVKLTDQGEGEYLAYSETGNTGARGEIEAKKNKKGEWSFKVSAWPLSDAKAKVSGTVDTQERAQLIIKAMAARGKGNAIIAVPGDGIFRIRREGESLLRVWDGAKKLDTTSTTWYQKPGQVKGEEPPTSIKSAEDWKAAKAYHGLEPLDTISGWSNALEAVAKKVNPEAPETVTTHDVDEWIKKKTEKPAKPETEKPAESRIERPTKAKADIFEMDEGDLADLFNERFGEPPAKGTELAAGRVGEYTFPTFEEFRDWMDARYAERDLDGMKLGFAEADTPFKIRYVKENRAADAHKKDWIAHLATGAPLPKESPPVPRTTPRPNARGGSAPPPATPAGPPPAPRPPTHHRKFDVMALTQMLRQLGKFPVMNARLERAYGRFVPGSNAVELKKRLMWDTALAERVLGHEIGHFIDLAIPLIGKGKMLAQRLRPLFDFKGQMWKAEELRNDARSLSRQWRGPFPNGHPYRDTANELFADFMSAMFNDPEWVNQRYPRLYDAFTEIRNAKPQFADAYREIETWLQGGTVAREWIDQQRDTVEKTHEILAREPQRSRASLGERLMFDMVSMWQRAFEKEGKPRALGTSVTEKLETSFLWSAQQLALWHDNYMKGVAPELAKVDKDPVTALGFLTAITQAQRTIGERRAAGAWIEANPVEARQMLETVLNLDPTLNSKWGSALSSASDPELYDLAAAVFRDVHDRGEKYVNRLAREIDDLNLGVGGQAALMAFNVRGKMLNPGGLTEDNAVKVLAELKDQLGPQKFKALKDAADNLRDLLFNVQAEMYHAGLISTKVWNELIAPNAGAYVPYAVLEYFDGRVRAGVMPQTGTAKDIADVAAATQLKVASSFVWLQKQRQVQLLREAYARGGINIPVGEELTRASDIDRIRAQHKNDDVSRAVLWVDGKLHLVEFPGDAGQMLQEALTMPEFLNHMEFLHDAAKWTHRVMQVFTQFSPRFLLYRNVVRGLRTGGLKVGFYNLARHLFRDAKADMRLARNYADAAFGGEMLPEVRDLVEREVLPAPHLAAGMVRDLPHLRELMARGTVPAYMMRRLHPGDVTSGPIREGARKVNEVTAKMFTAYEAFEKIYNYMAALEAGRSPETAAALARRGGIPRPGVAGKWSPAAEIFVPWTRVKTQGMRASYDILRDPALRKGYAFRFTMTEGIPRMLKAAIALGIVGGAIKWLTGDKEDNDQVFAEFLKRVSPYKMALDDVVPLWFYDPRKGQVHYLWEFQKGKDVPKHYEAVSLRIPASEEGNQWGTMLYAMMNNKELSKPGNDVFDDMGQWLTTQLLPQPSPALQTGKGLYEMIVTGHNPEDPFRHQPAANRELFDAGGVDRAQAIAGYAMNQAGGPGELAAIVMANIGALDKRAVDALKTRLDGDNRTWAQKVPYLSAVVSHDNYGQYRSEKLPEKEEEQLRIRARLVMSDDVRALYDFYNRNRNRQKKLTDSEEAQFHVADEFIKNVWGTLTKKGEPNPDSFYSKAAHAVGKDGSREAKATVKRDLDQAAAPYIGEFKSIRSK